MNLAPKGSPLRLGEALAIVGFAGALITAGMGSRRIEPRPEVRHAPEKGRWRGARLMRWPFLLVGLIGLVIMLVAGA